MNVWKIASRWSKTGTKKSSVLELFRKYNIVFAGKYTEKILRLVQKGDLVAISDGRKIVAVAKVISRPTAITNFTEIQEADKQYFDYEDWVVGFRVEIYNFSQDEIFETKIGTFHKMGKHTQRVLDIFNAKVLDNSKFEIKADNYNIFSQDSKQQSLFGDEKQYVIPIYQRPYSWNEEQIETFLNDIFISYWGTDKQSLPESMFIGTMQLSDKKYSDTASYYQEVIDGQQRITTITLFLKFLQNKYPQHTTLKDLSFTWLDSNVNRGQQSADLKEVLQNNKYDNDLNTFARNYKLIETYFELNIQSENENDINFDPNNFIDYLMESIYFVVIETRAGLSKTLQIFKAINTAGLDLDNTDVFKIRLYEYLSGTTENSDDMFESIDGLYEKIEIQNNKFNKDVASMSKILEIYKYYLIAKYGLNKTLWKMAQSTFFERLFDTLLDVKIWSDFKVLKEHSDVLDIKIIDKIIDIRYQWQHKHYGPQGTFDSFDMMLSLRLLWWSRYSRYWTIPFLYLMQKDATYDKYYELLQVLSRLYVVYSLLFQKQVNEIHSFTQSIATKIVGRKDTIDDIINEIKIKYTSKNKEVMHVIEGDVFSNPKIKNILLRMSAAIDENENNKPIKDIEHLVFVSKKRDIEHIKSRNDDDFSNNSQTKELWKNLLNTVGNLVILEEKINRSIGNSPFSEKIEQYKDSDFVSVKNLTKKTKWDIDDVEERKNREVSKIRDFLQLEI